MPTFTSDGFGSAQFVVASRFVQVAVAGASSSAFGVCQFEVEATLSNVEPPAVVTPPSGGGTPVDPGAGVNPGVTVTNPRGKFTLWAPTVSYTGWGGD